LVLDVDGTICPTRPEGVEYADLPVLAENVEQIRRYQERGYYLIYYTARQVRTHEGNQGKILAHTIPVLVDWLQRNKVPFDELYVGKPWPGPHGFYVDDRTVPPEVFRRLTDHEILTTWLPNHR